jgi:hypothetical protein
MVTSNRFLGSEKSGAPMHKARSGAPMMNSESTTGPII